MYCYTVFVRKVFRVSFYLSCWDLGLSFQHSSVVIKFLRPKPAQRNRTFWREYIPNLKTTVKWSKYIKYSFQSSLFQCSPSFVNCESSPMKCMFALAGFGPLEECAGVGHFHLSLRSPMNCKFCRRTAAIRIFCLKIKRELSYMFVGNDCFIL